MYTYIYIYIYHCAVHILVSRHRVIPQFALILFVCLTSRVLFFTSKVIKFPITLDHVFDQEYSTLANLTK